MDFAIHKNKSQTKHNYSATAMDVAYKFAKEIHSELADLVKAMVLFGSTAKQKQGSNDIDILIVVDDVSLRLTPELTQAYRILVEKTVAKVSMKIHVTSMKYTSFWEYVRSGDPVAINILRDGYPLIDTGFFEPLQMLLYQGRIRPSKEAIWAYMNRAPRTLRNSRSRLLEAAIDLYWAAVDSAQAALMGINEIPPSPEHVADILEMKLAKPGLLNKKFPWTMRKLYHLSKEIATGKKQDMTAQEYEKLYAETKEFVDAMLKFVTK